MIKLDGIWKGKYPTELRGGVNFVGGTAELFIRPQLTKENGNGSGKLLSCQIQVRLDALDLGCTQVLAIDIVEDVKHADDGSVRPLFQGQLYEGKPIRSHKMIKSIFRTSFFVILSSSS